MQPFIGYSLSSPALGSDLQVFSNK